MKWVLHKQIVKKAERADRVFEPEMSTLSEKLANLECPVCFESYSDLSWRLPKVLSCGHVLCSSCVDRLRDDVTVDCPVCRRTSYVGDTGRILEKVTSGQGRCQDCGATAAAVGVSGSEHCDRKLCAACLEDHPRGGLGQGALLLAKAAYYFCYYLIVWTHRILDRLLRCCSWSFARFGVVGVALAYGYAVYVLTSHVVRYVGDRERRPCSLPWRYEHFYWYSTRFELPWEVVVTGDGHVIVSDLRRNTVHDLTGDFLYDVAADADVGRGLAVDDAGNTYVTVGRAVHVHDARTGKSRSRLELRGDFDAVRGLAVHRKHLYACAGRGFNVLTTNGSHVMRYNLPTTAHHIAVSPNGDIAVSDAASLVAIYRQRLPEMNQLRRRKEIHAVWLSAGFTTPGGVLIDCDGFVIVSDTRSGRLVKFDADGEFIDYVTEPKALKKPQGLALTSEGDVIVCDHGQGLVTRFSSRCRYSTFTRLLGISWCSLVTGR